MNFIIDVLFDKKFHMKVFNTMFITICCTHGHLHGGTLERNFSTTKHPVFPKKSNKFTKSQTEILMKSFQATAYPKIKEIDQLAKSFNVSKKKIENWFSNKRFQLERKGMFSQSE